MYGLLSRRAKDNKLAYKLVLSTQDNALQLIHKTGNNNNIYILFFFKVTHIVVDDDDHV